MMLIPRTREEIAHHATNALFARGETFMHEDGPHRGRPLGGRRVNALISAFIREQKAQGRLLERRPYAGARSTKRVTKFFLIPQTADLFERRR